MDLKQRSQCIARGEFVSRAGAAAGRRLRVGWLAALVLAVAPHAALAQVSAPPSAPAGRNQPTPEQLRRFVSGFQASLLKGCLQSSASQKNAQTYCNCYANSFVRRYEPIELLAINNLVGQSRPAVQLVTVMMGPERRACAASSSR